MSDTINNNEEPPATDPQNDMQPAVGEDAGKKARKTPSKVQVSAKLVKQNEGLKTRLEKQTDLIKKLKEDNQALRSANSRVRRIPKAEKPPAAA